MKPTQRFGVVTLFPEMFEPFLNQGVFGRAVKKRHYTSGHV